MTRMKIESMENVTKPQLEILNNSQMSINEQLLRLNTQFNLVNEKIDRHISSSYSPSVKVVHDMSSSDSNLNQMVLDNDTFKDINSRVNEIQSRLDDISKRVSPQLFSQIFVDLPTSENVQLVFRAQPQ